MRRHKKAFCQLLVSWESLRWSGRYVVSAQWGGGEVRWARVEVRWARVEAGESRGFPRVRVGEGGRPSARVGEASLWIPPASITFSIGIAIVPRRM